eukprot:3950451-Amphidinium_carterae.1
MSSGLHRANQGMMHSKRAWSQGKVDPILAKAARRSITCMLVKEANLMTSFKTTKTSPPHPYSQAGSENHE